MLEGFDKGLESIDFTLPPEELKVKLAELANDKASGLVSTLSKLKDKNKIIDDKEKKQNESEKALSDATKEELDTLRSFKSKAEIETEEAGKNYHTAKEKYEEAHKVILVNLTETNTKALEEANEKTKGYESKLEVLLVDKEITKGLIELEVMKELADDMHLAIKSKTKFIDGKAMVGDKTLKEYLKEWGDTPAGKAARLAPNNNGGGSNNNGGKSNDNSGDSKKVKTEKERADEINKRLKNR